MRKLNETQIETLKSEFKGRGQIMAHSLKYLIDNHFFINKQFDNKSFSLFSVSDGFKSEGLMGLFNRKKDALEFAAKLGLKQVTKQEGVECKYFAWLSTKCEKEAIANGALYAGLYRNVPKELKKHLTEDSSGKAYVILNTTFFFS